MEIITNKGDETKKRLDELEFLTCKTQQRACHYEELSGKIFALDNEMKTLDSKMD